MTQHEDSVRLRHMLRHAREAVELSENRSRLDLEDHRLLQLGLARLIEIIGEAASKVSPQLKDELDQIPWPDIVNTRHRLIHAYDFVDYDILWQTIRQDLPPLISALEKALERDA